MAKAIVTIKVMPESPETDLVALEENVKEKIISFGGDVGKMEAEPLAFGLKSLNAIFVMEESIGSTEPLEEDIASLDQVASVEVTDVRRAIG